MQSSYDLDKRKLLSALCHGAIFFSAFVLTVGIPITILLISDDPVVKDNAREAINFMINVWFYGIVMLVLFWLLVGWLLLPFWFLYHWVLPIFAIVHCLRSPDFAFRYPLIVRLL
jgi:uncharacterized protein